MAKKENKIVRYQYVFYESFHDALRELTDEQYGRMMRAMNVFALYGDEPDLSSESQELATTEERMAWKLIRPVLVSGRNKARTKPNPNNVQTKRKPNANHTQSGNDISKEMDVDMEKEIDSGSSDDHYNKFVDWYNATTQNTNIPKILYMTDERKKLFDTIREKYGSEAIAEVVGKAIRSDYLSGEKSGAPRMTIDWLLQEQNFVKAMEGKYNDD